MIDHLWYGIVGLLICGGLVVACMAVRALRWEFFPSAETPVRHETKDASVTERT